MSSGDRRARTPRQYLGGGLLPCVVVYVLNLCTPSPHVHADLLSRAVQAHRHSPHPCALPSTASESTASTLSRACRSADLNLLSLVEQEKNTRCPIS